MDPKNAYTQTFLRKRKFLVVLPVLIIPFLTLAFWALGGGRARAQGRTPAGTLGLNLQLPPAHIPKEAAGKLQFYEQTEGDSMRHHHFFTWDTAARNTKIYTDTSFTGNTSAPEHSELTPYGAKAYQDSNEETIYQKLAALQAQIQVPTRVPLGSEAGNQYRQQEHAAAVPRRDVGDLAAVLPHTGNGDRSEGDPELHQLNSMMDKILDIQHPERMTENIKAQSLQQQENIFPVIIPTGADSITLLERQGEQLTDTNIRVIGVQQDPAMHNGFYSLEADDQTEVTPNSIEAVVPQTQTILSGATIKLRLLRDVYIHGVLVPKNQFIYGLTSLSGERLQVHISSIRQGNNLLPVDLSVYDLDGLEGIFVPGTLTRDAASQASEKVMQGVELNTMNHALASQAAHAGIEAAKTLFTKNARLVKVSVKAGYQVLLHDNKQP